MEYGETYSYSKKGLVLLFRNLIKMKSAKQIADQFREVYLSGKWVVVTNLKEQLSDVTWEQATTKIGSFNTISALASHLDYYIAGVSNVLKGGTLDIRDKYSFDFPPIQSKEDWEKVLEKIWENAETFASLVEQMSDEKLDADFVDKKYGTYRRNMHALIEHSYYHLGQIVLIKKMLKDAANK